MPAYPAVGTDIIAPLLPFCHRECTLAEHLDERMPHRLNGTGTLKTGSSLSTVGRRYAEREGWTIDRHRSATSRRIPWTQKIAILEMLSSLNFLTAPVRTPINANPKTRPRSALFPLNDGSFLTTAN
jgi:hypothetical protein